VDREERSFPVPVILSLPSFGPECNDCNDDVNLSFRSLLLLLLVLLLLVIHFNDSMSWDQIRFCFAVE
jgi:hypothetical protein